MIHKLISTPIIWNWTLQFSIKCDTFPIRICFENVIIFHENYRKKIIKSRSMMLLIESKKFYISTHQKIIQTSLMVKTMKSPATWKPNEKWVLKRLKNHLKHPQWNNLSENICFKKNMKRIIWGWGNPFSDSAGNI